MCYKTFFILGIFHSYIINVYIVMNLYTLIIQNMHFFAWNLISVELQRTWKQQLFGKGDFINNTVTFPNRHLFTMTILTWKLNTKLVFYIRYAEKFPAHDWGLDIRFLSIYNYLAIFNMFALSYLLYIIP